MSYWDVIVTNVNCDQLESGTNWPGGSSPPSPAPAAALSKHSTTKTECPRTALGVAGQCASSYLTVNHKFWCRRCSESIELEQERWRMRCKAESQKLFQSLTSLSDFIRHCIANKVPNSSSLKFPNSQFSSFFFAWLYLLLLWCICKQLYIYLESFVCMKILTLLSLNVSLYMNL